MNQKAQLKQLLSNTSALLQAMRYSTATASGEYADIGRWTSFGMFLRKYNDLAKRAGPLLTNPNMLDMIKVDNLPTSGATTWPAQKELFDLAYSNTTLLKSLLEGAIGYAEDETRNLRDFIQANNAQGRLRSEVDPIVWTKNRQSLDGAAG